MLGPKGQRRLIGGRTICFVLVILLGGMTWCSSGVTWGGTSSWLDWLFALFSADDIPQRPPLTEQDRIAIDKTRALLETYGDSASNSLMLGVFAAADGNAPVAREYFKRAYASDSAKSLLPLTMAAQTYVQVGNYAEAKLLHSQILQESGSRGSPLALQKINAYLDLAVVCSKLKELDEAAADANRAKDLLQASQGSLSATQMAFAYLQLGTVYGDSLRNSVAAQQAWQAGQALSEQQPDRVNPRIMLQLNLKMIENQPKDAPEASLNRYFKNASQAITRLDGESRLAAQTRLGEQFADLAVKSKGTPQAKSYADLAESQLRSVRELPLTDASAERAVLKARAIEAEKKIAGLRRGRTSSSQLNKEMETAEKHLMAERLKSSTELRPPQP